MSSACAAEFASKLGQTNSMVTIFDEDNFGQFIQFIQNPGFLSLHLFFSFI